jgi:glycosyltransferase involved in cell wall biosynthesis
MILLVHNNNLVVEVLHLETNQIIDVTYKSPTKELFKLAEQYHHSILVWCHVKQKDNLNIEGLKASFNLKNMMMSYSKNQYLPLQIGYVEDSPFLKVNTSVKYPTWLMSSTIGAIYASTLKEFKNAINLNSEFNYSLNAIAKLGMPNGLFCYSEPNLLKQPTLTIESEQASLSTLFKFVKQHYRLRWIWLLLLNYFWHEKKMPLFSALKSLFYKKNECSKTIALETIVKVSDDKPKAIDVIIPTIGRKQYLYDVLKYLSEQTLLPKKVIIIEQNPDVNSKTELDYIEKESWPFKINHVFTHQTGACNARNIALGNVESDFVFFADDDIAFKSNTLQDAVSNMATNFINAMTVSCLRPEDKLVYSNNFQWNSFGSGCSFVVQSALKDLKFNMAFEHGFGEDADYGMQLRNKGVDVVYNPSIKLVHLKAPVGGFRTKFVHPWEHDQIKPKPSPTVMLNRILNTTKHQILGYKTILFIKFYKNQKIKNPITYFKSLKRQWNQSEFWANKLNQNTRQ